jgi:hypothetical protein
MKEAFFNTLYCLGLALIFGLIVIAFLFIVNLIRNFMKKLDGESCGHHFRQMTDKVGSPIKCMDCGKIMNL